MNDLAHLSDDVLLTSLKRLTGTSNELTAQLLAHLGEVESRGIHRNMACASLYTYCVYELRMSEDEAQRRCSLFPSCTRERSPSSAPSWRTFLVRNHPAARRSLRR
jgi:hypothetical protein